MRVSVVRYQVNLKSTSYFNNVNELEAETLTLERESG